MIDTDASLPVLPPRFGKSRCPRCGSRLRLPDNSTGRKVKCPSCEYRWRNGGKPISPSTDALHISESTADEDSRPPTGLRPNSAAATLEEPAASAPDETVTAHHAADWFTRNMGPQFEPIDCTLLATDAETGVQQRYQGLLYHEGLLLRRGDERLLVPVGSTARYEGDDRFTIFYLGRPIALRLFRGHTATNTLTFELCRFMNREVETVDLEAHLKSTWLFALAALPLGLILASGFSPLWIGFAGVLVLVCVGIARAKTIPYLSRLLGVAGLAFVGYLVWGLVEMPVLLQPQKPAASQSSFSSTP